MTSNLTCQPPPLRHWEIPVDSQLLVSSRAVCHHRSQPLLGRRKLLVGVPASGQMPSTNQHSRTTSSCITLNLSSFSERRRAWHWLLNCQIHCMKQAALPMMLRTLHPNMGGPFNSLSRFVKDLENWWCIHVHDAPMWPINGQYQCRTCGRSRAVTWAQPPAYIVPDARCPKARVLSPTDYHPAKQA